MKDVFVEAGLGREGLGREGLGEGAVVVERGWWVRAWEWRVRRNGGVARVRLGKDMVCY